MKAERGAAFPVRLRFFGGLDYFLRPRGTSEVERLLHEKTSVKDVIEACGVPHPEVDLIVASGVAVDFGQCLQSQCDLEVYGVPAPPQLERGRALQRREVDRFVADGHLGKLVRNLRLLGVDVLYDRDAHDDALVALAAAEQRALLTRDRRLLMHRAVRDGYCPRSSNPEEQTDEVLRRFQLVDALHPYTRCLRCNGLLVPVSKSEIIDQLEPLTRAYYDTFCRCEMCGRVYWAGSHATRLAALIEWLRLN